MTEFSQEFSNSPSNNLSDSGADSGKCDQDKNFQAIFNKLPIFLQNVLKTTGFANEETFANITEEDFSEIETFVRNDLVDLIKKEEYPEYYGVYANNPTKFCILPGFKKLIKLMVVELNNSVRTRNEQEVSSKRSQSKANTRTETVVSEIKRKRQHIDLENEEKKIKHLIIGWIKSKGGILKPELQKVINNEVNEFSIEVEIADEDLMSAKIKCPCSKFERNVSKKKTNLDIKILKTLSNNTKRWQVSNFYKHFTKHIDYLISNKETENEKNKIISYLSKSKAKKKESGMHNSLQQSPTSGKAHKHNTPNIKKLAFSREETTAKGIETEDSSHRGSPVAIDGVDLPQVNVTGSACTSETKLNRNLIITSDSESDTSEESQVCKTQKGIQNFP